MPAGGYQHLKTGMDGVVDEFKQNRKNYGALRSAASILSAVIGKGGITVKDGGEIVAEGGAIRAIHEATGAAMAYFGKLMPPYRSGLMTATEDGTPYFWAAVNEDGTRVFHFGGTSLTVAATSQRADVGTSYVNASSYHRVDAAEYIMLNAPQIRPYQMGDTGTAPNLALDVIGGVPVLKRSVSSDRFKTDIAPIEVDPEDVIAYRGITWVHNSTMDASPPGDIRRNIGHHAEAMDQFPSLRQFVNYDKQGRPESVQEGRFDLAELEVLKVVWHRLNAVIAHLGLDPNELGA